MNRRIVIFALLCVLALGGISAAVHMHNETGNQAEMNADGCIITQYSDATEDRRIVTQLRTVDI